MSRPFNLGLTGSVGMGKSTVARMFEDLGIPVFDSDAVVHRLQGPGGKLVSAIEAAFPGSTGPQGVDRKALGEAVFANPEALARLEAVVHPAVRAERREFQARYTDETLVVFDIPLLFEKGGVDEVDAVLVVSAPPEMQRQRVLARPGMTAERFADILARQLPDAQKRARADHVIDTGRPLAETRGDVARLVEKLAT
jgi:dephospho-CoA kinase